MIKLTSNRSIQAPPWLIFEMIRNVDVHAAAVPEIQARVEKGRMHGAPELNEKIRWSANYFRYRFKITMQVTKCDVPFRYNEVNCTGPFKVFRHTYTVKPVSEKQTQLSDQLEFETGFGWLGWILDTFVFAPRLRSALDVRMDHLKEWSEDGSWQKWISEKPPPSKRTGDES